jgi:spermidine/putrescine transport system substrate-binding protein
MTERDQQPVDPALLRGLTQRRLSRRDVFKYAGAGAGALSLSSILAACSSGGTSSSSGTQAIDWNAKPNGIVHFANWPLYIDKEKNAQGQIVHPSLEQFTKDTNIKVDYREVIQANESYFGQIQPQLAAGDSIGEDIIVITNGQILSRLMQLKYLVPLPKDKRPNFDQYGGPAIKNPAYDPGNQYTMAWQSGITGIAWDPAQVAQLRPSNPTITSINDLWDPAFKGKVGMFGDTADLPNTGLLAIGVKPEESTPDDWQKAADHLTAQKPLVRQYYEQNYINALSNGDTAVTMGWSGDIFQTNLGNPTQLKFTVPPEGALIWTDNMCIPIGVQNPVDAIMMMDYVYKPEIQAMIEDYNNYICPVPAAQAIIADPKGINDPTASMVKNLHTYRVLTDAETTQWNDIFQPVYQS